MKYYEIYLDNVSQLVERGYNDKKGMVKGEQHLLVITEFS